MTNTRLAYKSTYRPAVAPANVDSACSCGQMVSTADLFSHDCPDDIRSRHSRVRVATSARDSLDVPEWRGGAAGHSPRKSNGTAPIRTRANKFAGRCEDCGQHVLVQAGRLDHGPKGWEVRHLECPSKAETPAPEVAETHTVADGYYAIGSTGVNDLAFYRVSHSAKWGVSLQLVVGGHPDRFVARRNVAGIVERIASDPDAAARYGREIGSCYLCNRTLTDESSRSLGIGPVCRAGGF